MNIYCPWCSRRIKKCRERVMEVGVFCSPQCKKKFKLWLEGNDNKIENYPLDIVLGKPSNYNVLEKGVK